MYEIHPDSSPHASTTNHYDTVNRLQQFGQAGIVLVNFPVTQGIRRQNVDLLAITPTGCHVITIVRTEAQGPLLAPPRGPWMVGDNPAPFGATESNPSQVARATRDLLTRVMAEGWGDLLTPMVAINTKWMRLPDDATYISVNGVNVTTLNNMRRRGLPDQRVELNVADAVAILSMLGVPAHLVPDEDVFTAEGFKMPPDDGSFIAPSQPLFQGEGATAARPPGAAGFVRNLVESSGDFNGIQSKWGRRASLGLAAFDGAKSLHAAHLARKNAAQAAAPQPNAAAPGTNQPPQQPRQQPRQPYTQAYTEPQQPPTQPFRASQPTSPTPQADSHAISGEPSAPVNGPAAPKPHALRTWDRTVTALTIMIWCLAALASMVGRFDLGVTAMATDLYALTLVLAGIALPGVYMSQRSHIELVLRAQEAPRSVL